MKIDNSFNNKILSLNDANSKASKIQVNNNSSTITSRKNVDRIELNSYSSIDNKNDFITELKAKLSAEVKATDSNDIYTKKLDDIKEQISSGTYKIDPFELAKIIIKI